jgi:hypothetical protein
MNRDLTKNPGPIGETEFKYLLEMLSDTEKVQSDSEFLLKSYCILVETMKHLLSEMSLAARFTP